ncbi:SPT3 Dosage dependent suppressor of Ty-induced promoter mutations-like protein [Mucor circinelloides]
MSTTSPMMGRSGSTATHNHTEDGHFQTCDSPSGSSTSEPHDDAMNLQQPSFIDQSFFYKLDQLSPDNPLYFMQQQQNLMQQQQQQQQIQQQQQQQLHQAISPSLSPPPSLPSPSHTLNSLVDPLLPNASTSNDNNPTFWSGFNNAIPNLAKNFTEYISGYPMDQSQQQSAQQQYNNPQLNEIKYKQEQPTIVNTTLPGMQIRVLGVPQTGAKSRVETQIKLCIQLVTDDGDKAQWWSHLKLPEHMVAKDKLKRQILLSTAPNGSKIANVAGLDANVKPEKMLYLTARVICASDPSRKVVTCIGCIQRERKRSQRRKENKIKPDEDNSAMMTDDEKSLAMEEQKVLLFNCSEVVDFSSGDTILPTRITCYCRHHNERLGFCIYFEMHDHSGKQVATGMSPPIMITDDHKSNKIKSGRKRLRTDTEKPASAVSSPFDTRHAANVAISPLAYQQPHPHHQQQQQHPTQQLQQLQQQQRFNTQQYNIQPRPPSVPVDARSPHTPLESPMVTANTSPFMSNATEKASSPAPSTPTAAVDRPLLQRLIPNEGPTFGGVEVTLLGSGFRAGLTCMFGDIAASSTHYWSPNTLVCILPPAAEAGTVVVSFKEHPLVVDSQDVTLFTYYNENDRALMELALQVVGLKMTGKVEDARDIAMRIVQGGSGSTGGGSGGGGGGGNQDSNSNSSNQQQHSQMSLERHIIQVLEVMRTFRDVESADVSLTSAQGHTMLHLAAMLGFSMLTETLIDLGCDVDVTDKNGYTALHYSAWYNHEQVVHVLLDKGFADPEISNRWNKKPLHLTSNSSIKHALWSHVPLIEEDDYSDSIEDTSSVMSADVDTSFAEDESDLDDTSSVWLSDIESENQREGNQAWPQRSSSSWLSDSEESMSSMDDEPVYEGLRYRHNRQTQQHATQTQQVQLYQQNTPTIQYLNQGESTSHSADEILDAQPVHEVDHSTDYEDNDMMEPKEEMSWMQRTLSHFQQQPTDNNSFLQNIKNNIPAKPAELNLKNIADHLLQFPRPATMVANMSALFGQDQADNKQEEPAEQTLAWYMALAYAMGARSLTEEEQLREEKQEQSSTSSSSQQHVHVLAKKRRDKRLFSFWVPMLCLMVIWLIFQFVSSHPGMVDTIIGLTGFRRQYLTIH